MKILHISSGDYESTYGGGQVYVRRLVEAMQDLAEVSVLSFTAEQAPETWDNRPCGKARLYRLPQQPSPDLWLRLLDEIKPDIVHAHGHKAEAARACEQKGIPCIVTAHHGGILCPDGMLMNTHDAICHVPVSHKNCLACCLRNIRCGLLLYPLLRLLPAGLYRRIGTILHKLPFIYFVTPIGCVAADIAAKQQEWRDIYQKATLLIAPSRLIQESMVRNGCPSEKIRLLPHGVPLPTFSPTFPPVLNRAIRFYYVGRISYIKGLHILLKAFHNIDDPRIELHIIGSAGNKGERHYQARLQAQYSDDTRILWHGKIPSTRIPELTRDFHVMVHPAIFHEVFGLTIAEALVQGKWVLATRCGGAEMQIEEGKNGWLIEPNSLMALQNGIQRIIQEPPEAASSTTQDLSLGHHTTRLLRLYQSLISR